MARRRRNRNGIAGDLVKGAIAGAVATFVMGKITNFAYQQEAPEVREEEDEARGGETSYSVAAGKTARLAGTSLSRRQRERAGSAIHWALGIGAGAVYAVLRRRLDAVGAAAGTAFGTAFWALVDEGLVPILGLTPGPRAFPWQTHARGFLGHLSFGTVTDRTLRVLDGIA